MRVLTLFSFAFGCAESSFQLRGEWDVPNAATVSVANDLAGIPGASLVGTSFSPFGADGIFAVSSLNPLNAEGTTVANLSTDFSWPNQVYQLTEDMKASAGLDGEHLLVADGFIFPGKDTGGIHLLKVREDLTTEKQTITQDKKGWFFHHAEWFDVDEDGLMDVVSARSNFPLVANATKDSELVWIRSLGQGQWGNTEVITKGPGVGFIIVDVNGDGKSEIISTEFYRNQRIAVYSCPLPTWAQCAVVQGSIKESVVDTGDGPFFQDSWVDLNGDGRKDLLATAQQDTVDGEVVPGKVLAFECPEGWVPGSTAKWTRHVLADGYLPQPTQAFGSGAPGVPSAFVMDAAVGGKPHVVFSADDGGVVDLLTPSSQDPSDWGYSKETLYKTEAQTGQGVSTIGSVTVADIDGDGRPEIFVPAYVDNMVLMYSQVETAVSV